MTTPLPKDPDRERIARALLRSRRVAALLDGRGPVRLPELAAMLATATGISRGMAEAAVARAIEVGEVEAWVTIAPAAEPPGPDPDAILDEFAEGAAALEAARREAAEG
jgi:hypothetical protein